MRVLFVRPPPTLRELDKQLIVAALSAHHRVFKLGLVTGGRTKEQAEAEAITAVQAFASESFPDLTVEILPDATQ